MKVRAAILVVVYGALVALASVYMHMGPFTFVVQLVAVVGTFFVVSGLSDPEVLELD
jgi:uncharacterized membrane protein HdeD (DUF308 family)